MPHPTIPNFGQGGCMAIDAAVVLARHLRGEGALERRLAQFAAERYPRTSAITLEAGRFGQTGQWERPMSCWLRDRLFGVLLPLIGSGSLPKYAAFDVGPLPAAMTPAAV